MTSLRLTRLVFGCSLLMLPVAIASTTVAFPEPVHAQAKTPNQYTGIAKQVDEMAQQITVLINSKNNGNGSGAIVAKEGNTYYVLTAAHVVKNPDNYTLTAPDGTQYNLDARQMTVLEEVDLAVVQFTSQKTYKLATLARYNLKDNFWVFVSGFPKSAQEGQPQRLLTAGKVWKEDFADFAAKDQYSLSSGGRGLVYTSLSKAGMSGGPVLDSRGYVVGINTAAENELEVTEAGQIAEISLGFSLGVPIGTFASWAEKMKVHSQELQVETTAPPALSTSEVESIAASLGRVPVPNANASAFDWLNYGNQLWRFERFSEAVSAFEQAISLQGDFYQAYYGKGLAFWYAGKNPEALVAFEQATQLYPNFPSAWRYQGSTLKQLKKNDLALAAYDKAVELQADNFVLHVERGNVLGELKRFTEAVTAYDEAIKIQSHPWAYNNRGNVYTELKDYPKALADYNQALSLNPDDANAYNNRGNVYKELKDYPKALADFERALSLNPDYAGAYYNRGSVYSKLKDYPKALADYNQALSLNPDLAQAYYNRGNTYNNLKQYQRAIEDYDRAIALNPNDAKAYNNRGLTYSELKQHQRAIEDFNRAIALNPDYTIAYINRGVTYSELKQYQRAIEDYDRAIALNPEYGEAYMGQGLVYLQLGEKEKAIIEIEKATQLFCQQGSPKCQQAQEILRQLQSGGN
jgi:tetratricopeptide (TPR) repeat protein